MSWILYHRERTLVHTEQEAGVGPIASLDGFGEEKPLAPAAI